MHEIKRETLLSINENSLLRSLFLTYHVIESEQEKDEVLIEIFKFVVTNKKFGALFSASFSVLDKTRSV